jgi:chloride channel protein, CIC family
MDDNRQGEIPSSVEIGAEVREYMSLQGQRRRLFPRAMLMGLLAGGAAVLFRWALEYGDALRDRLLVWVHQYPTWGWLLPMVVGALGLGVRSPWCAS